jgi:hypothetical protein
LLGNGDGTFRGAVTYDAGRQALSVAVGDFNGDGYPDFAAANLAGTVHVLLNAADWHGGPAAGPPKPRGAALQRHVHGQVPLDPLSVQQVSPGLQANHQLPFTLAHLPPDPVQPVPVESDRSQPGRLEAPPISTPLVTARHALDLVWEGWSDPVGDVLAVSPMRGKDANDFQDRSIPSGSSRTRPGGG